MLLSGITHPAQMLFYGTDPEIRGPALPGTLFFFVGLLLLTRYRLALCVAVLVSGRKRVGDWTSAPS